MSPPQDPRESPRSLALLAAGLLLLALAFTWPALTGDKVWDDEAHITRPALQSLSGLAQIWTTVHATQQYYPLLHSAFWTEHLLWGDATLGYHLLNVLLHAAAAFLVVVILRRLGIPGARLAGVLFTVHPVSMESVAWISEQKNTLSLVLYLLAALTYLTFDAAEDPRSARTYVLSTVLFILALLTKSVTATLPGALLVLLWWKRGRLSVRRDLPPLLPWFGMALGSGLLTSWVERTIGGAEGTGFDLTLVERCFLAARITWFYLGKLILPVHLALIYPRWEIEAGALNWTPYLLASVALTAALAWYARRSRGPLAAWLFFVGTLFPALGFFNVYPFLFSYVADHFQYTASLGFLVLVSAGLSRFLSHPNPSVRGPAIGIAAAVVALLVLESRAQSATFTDPKTLWTSTLEENPKCWIAEDGLGLWYKTHGDMRKAVLHYQEALAIRKDYPQGLNNLGVCFEDQGNPAQAVTEFREALRLKPDFPEAENNLGSALAKTEGGLDEAILHFEKAIRLLPDFASAHTNLGTALLQKPERLNDAIAEFREAVRLLPGSAEAHANLGDALSNTTDRLSEAATEYQASLALGPGNAQVHSNLGLVLNALGRPSAAIDQYAEALRLQPDFVEIHLNWALALLNIPGHRGEAAVHLEAYLRVRPANDMTQQIASQIQSAQP